MVVLNEEDLERGVDMGSNLSNANQRAEQLKIVKRQICENSVVSSY